jgi:hypothetical protein
MDHDNLDKKVCLELHHLQYVPLMNYSFGRLNRC